MPPVTQTRTTNPAAADGQTASNQSGQPSSAAVHARVLSLVAERICRGDDDDADRDCVGALCDALLASPEVFDRALAQLRKVREIGAEDIVDSYIPAMAARLGEDWMESRRSFAEVTIGTARLVSAVREFSARWCADALGRSTGPNVAMIVPGSEQHRLGALIAASQFRRLGVSVRLVVGCADDEIATVVRKGAFDMVTFSLATRASLEHTRRMLQMLRQVVDPMPPVVVGGAVGTRTENLRALLGVDHVVSDPEEALRRCGMSVSGRRTAMTAAGPQTGLRWQVVARTH